MQPQDRIQQSIFSHGRIRSVRLLTSSEYSVEHQDGFAYVVEDPRVEEQGPIRSVALADGPGQSLSTSFDNLWSTAIFADRDRSRRDAGAAPAGAGRARDKRRRKLEDA